MVKSHVASDISCTFPADSVPPVPALLQILAREHKSHQPKTATFVRGLVWRAPYISNRPPTLTASFTTRSTSSATVTSVFTKIALPFPYR